MSRSKNIKLHKEYGLNPTMCTCFYCGEETGEIALLGAAYEGEAPSHMCTSLEPCDKCKEKYKDYVLIVEVGSRENETPTGRYFAIKKELVNVPNKGIMLMHTEEFSSIVDNIKGGK